MEPIHGLSQTADGPLLASAKREVLIDSLDPVG
jgi:hypothetical protein